MPNPKLYIMLYLGLNVRSAVQRASIALLVIISLNIIHSKALADTKSDLAEKHHEEGFKLFQKGRLNEALGFYTKALNLGAQSPNLFNDAGVLYENIGLPVKAETYYLNAIALDKKFLPAYTNLAYLYLNIDDVHKAAEYFKLRFELAKVNDPWAQKVKEELLKLRPEYAHWIEILEAKKLEKEIQNSVHQAFSEKVKRSQQHFMMAEKLFEEKYFEAALNEYTLALQLTPGNPKIIEGRRKTILEYTEVQVRERSEKAIRMIHAGDPDSAKNEFRKILNTLPNNPVIHSQ